MVARAITAAVLAPIFVSPGLATSISIADPSFETPVESPGGFGFITGTGWTATGGTPVIDYPLSNQFASVPDGNQVVILDDFNGTGTLSQTLAATLAANTIYTLKFYVGNDSLLPYTGYSAALSANGVTLASDASAVSPTAGHFLQDTITFTTGANPAQLGQALTITFSDVNFAAVAFDLVQLDGSPAQGGSVPEPTTWVLLAAGLGFLAVAKLKKRLVV